MIHAITKKQVAIVSFEQDERNKSLLESLHSPAPRVIYYSVTLDPSRLSPDGYFVRFGQWGDGQGAGDELTGWVPLNDLTVQEVLADWDGQQFVPVQISAERAA